MSILDFSQLLIGFVQIAISLAAFTTIATIVVRISDTTSENLLAVRLKTILLYSMHLVVLSVLPLVLYQLTPGDVQFWRSSALLALVSVCLVNYQALFIILPKVISDPKNSWLQTISVIGFSTASVITGVLTIFLDNPAFWYMITLTLVLASALAMVIGLVLSFPVFDVHRAKSPPEES